MPYIGAILNRCRETINPYLKSIPATFEASGLVFRSIKDHKKSAIFALGGSVFYTALTYYEWKYFADIIEEWNVYRSVFPQVAQHLPKSNFCPQRSFLHGIPTQEKCSAVEGSLYKSLTIGQNALAKYIGITVFKPLILEAVKQILAFSLRSTLIQKWLGTSHNHLGLQILDPSISLEASEIIENHSYFLVWSVTEAITLLFDLLIALGKMYDIYQAGNILMDQGLDFHVALFTLQALGLYLFVHCVLSVLYKQNNEKNSTNQTLFKNNMTFNMASALQIKSSQATSHESNLLQHLLTNLTKTNALTLVLGSSINTVATLFNHYLSFVLLNQATPSIMTNPVLYFSLQNVLKLIDGLSNNMWQIAAKLSSSSILPFSLQKINHFLTTIEKYLSLLALEKVKFTVNAQVPLSCKLSISYPTQSEQKVLIEKLEHTFHPSRIYGILGPSGSGKSSFFNTLVGINPFAEGEITIPPSENVFYVPQYPIFKPNLNWKETIFYPLSEIVPPDLELETQMLNWIRALKLEEVYERAGSSTFWSSYLSGGEKQRIALLQVLAKTYLRRKHTTDNIVVLLDEALSALDDETSRNGFNLLKEHVEGHQLTALHIDHSAPEVIKERYKEHIVDLSILQNDKKT